LDIRRVKEVTERRELVKHPHRVGRRTLVEFDCVGVFIDA